METSGGVLGKSDRGSVPYVLRPHRADDMSVVVRQEGAGYTEQYGWDKTFEALVARIVDEGSGRLGGGLCILLRCEFD